MDDSDGLLIYVRDLPAGTYDDRRGHARAAEGGAETRVAHGVYADAVQWGSLDRRARYIARVEAIARTRLRRPVVSHWSAAALHGLPVVSQKLDAVHITAPEASGGRSYPGVTMHCVPLCDEEVVEVNGLLVTSLARTLIDIAASATAVSSVPALDHALHLDRGNQKPPLLTKAELWDAHSRRMPFVGHARARTAIEFAVATSDSPLESVSRVNMREIGFPVPELQHRFDDHRGLIGFSEFYWPEYRLVGEADGQSKYTDPKYRRGRSLEQVLLDEKERADRIRALGETVSRWGWSTAINPRALRAHLLAAGLPLPSKQLARKLGTGA
jgi:hypothetical protein